MTSPEHNHLLLVEDDVAFARLLSAYLDTAGFKTTCCESGQEMFHKLETMTPSLILLDLELPDEDGLVLSRRLRQVSDLPIIIVTGRADQNDRIVGLEMGADDYVQKPFDPRELIARVRNVLARTRNRIPKPAKISSDGVTIQAADHLVIGRQGETIHLTPTESSILNALIRANGRPLRREQLLDAGGEISGSDSPRSIDITISRLRRKLERDPKFPKILLTVQGLGYRIHLD